MHLKSVTVVVVTDITVLYDYISSDHKPISVKFGNILDCAVYKHSVVDNSVSTQRCWNDINDLAKLQYAAYLDHILQNVVVPHELQMCLATGSKCVECNHESYIVDYYIKINVLY